MGPEGRALPKHRSPNAAAVFFVLITYVLVNVPAAAQADDALVDSNRRAEAQARLELGNRFFREGRLAEALDEYRAAHSRFSSAKLFFNIARCESALGRDAEAHADFHRFLREATDAAPDLRAEAERQLSALAARLVKVDIKGALEDARFSLDGSPFTLATGDEPLVVAPGTHRLRVERAGAPIFERTFDGEAGAYLEVTVPKQPLAPPNLGLQQTKRSIVPIERNEIAGVSREAEQRSRLGRWWLWAGVGSLVVAGIVGAVVLTRPDRPSCVAVACAGP